MHVFKLLYYWRMHGERVNIALRHFLHNHGNIGTEGSPKNYAILLSYDFKGSL